MVITIDVGNSDIVSVLYNEDGEKINKSRVSLIVDDLDASYDDFVTSLIKLFEIDHCDYIVSCVVPKVKTALEASLNKYLSGSGYFIDYTSFEGISKHLKYPAEIGADLIAASVKVIQTRNEPTIIVDMGSATKIILVDHNTINGVSIMLGVKNNIAALSSKIKHLPSVDLKFSEQVLGLDTVASIQSGLMYSALYTIQGYVLDIEKQYGYPLNKIITGGLSSLFISRLEDFEMLEDLVNDGLYEIYTLKRDDSHA